MRAGPCTNRAHGVADKRQSSDWYSHFGGGIISEPPAASMGPALPSIYHKNGTVTCDQRKLENSAAIESSNKIASVRGKQAC